jgi:signal transduction histidine kinase
MRTRKILVVDDEPQGCQVLREFFESKGYHVVEAYNGDEALALYSQEKPYLVLLDIRMPGKDGIQTLRELKALDPEVGVFMVTAVKEEGASEQAIREGAFEYITKPINPHSLETNVGRFNDIRQYIAKIEALNLQLKQANQHKMRFLFSMSHELRTPLNAIIGFSDLLRGKHYGPLNEKQDVYVTQIEESSRHLLSLINGLLDMAKIDAGRIMVREDYFSWDEMIRSIALMMNPQVQEKGIDIEVEVDELLKNYFAGDGKLCKQILFNLLSNAIKFTPEGGAVAVRAHAENGWVRVSVSDTGIGIPEEHQDKIFSEFHQVDCRSQDGAGIGLALTHRLVELLGGEIGVESEADEGTTFCFTLPLKGPPASKKEDDQANEPELVKLRGDYRILVAEDNEVNLAMILDMLATQGHEAAVARNGLEAVELAVSFRPDLILMDIKMPVMDGLEATRRIRRIPELSDAPIIALTASAEWEAVASCLASGCTDHLSKPIQSKDLFAALKAHLEAKSMSSERGQNC